MNSNTSILLNILEAEDRVLPTKQEEFKQLQSGYKSCRLGSFLSSTTLGILMGFSLLSGMNTKMKKTQVKATWPLFGVGIATYYLSTTLDYFVSQHYFGKILSTVRIDEDIFRLIQEECKVDYEILTNFYFK